MNADSTPQKDTHAAHDQLHSYYRHMPAHGLGEATTTVPATGSLKSAADRLDIEVDTQASS